MLILFDRSNGVDDFGGNWTGKDLDIAIDLIGVFC